MSAPALALVSTRRPNYAGNTRQRGRQKWNAVANYLHRWHYSDTPTLLQLLGLDHTNTGNRTALGRWVSRGLLHRVDAEYHRYPVYLLTVRALALVRDPVPLYYNTRPSSIKLKEVAHDIAVQRLCLARDPEAVPARLFDEWIRTTAKRNTAQRVTPLQLAIDEAEDVLQLLARDPLMQFALHTVARDHGLTHYLPDDLPEAEAVDAIGSKEEGRAYQALVNVRDAISALEDFEQNADEPATYLNAKEDSQDHVRRPDAVISANGHSIAIEVERSRKNNERYERIFLAHARAIKKGYYRSVEFHCGFGGLADLYQRFTDAAEHSKDPKLRAKLAPLAAVQSRFQFFNL